MTAFTASLVVLRHGIAITPDGWAYWQGSVSLLEGRGYAFLYYGVPIQAWPPLYSLYLAAWQAVFGVSGATLVLATAATTGLATFAWALWLGFMVREGDDGRSRAPALVWIGATLVLSAMSLLSEILFHAILPLVLASAALTWTRRQPRALLLASLALGGSLAAALLVRNAALALVPASVLALLVFSAAPLRWRALGAALVAALALLPWWAVRHALDQGGSHRFTIGGREDWLETTRQLVEGLGEHLASGIAGVLLAVALVFALSVYGADRWRVPPALLTGVRRLLIYVACTCAGLYALFLLTPVGSRLGGRFTLFAVLAVVPAFLWLGAGLADRRLRVAATTALLFWPLLFLVWRVGRGAVPTEVAPESPELHQAVALSTSISSRHLALRSERVGDRLYVAPPIYEWQRARFERARNDLQEEDRLAASMRRERP